MLYLRSHGIVEALYQAGAFVIIADIDEENGQKASEDIQGQFIKLDVTDQQACKAIIKEIIDEHGKLDILCSNTGIFFTGDD